MYGALPSPDRCSPSQSQVGKAFNRREIMRHSLLNSRGFPQSYDRPRAVFIAVNVWESIASRSWDR
jgi:hypothetical protein